MNEFKVINKTYVKSQNKTSTIKNRYTISLIAFTILTLLIYLLTDNINMILPLILSLIKSFVIASIFGYLINIIKKKYSFIKIYKEDNIHILAIIIGLFSVNLPLIPLVIAIIISLIIKNINKNIDISCSLYAILFILIYKYLNNELITPLISIKNMHFKAEYKDFFKNGKEIINYLVGTYYLNPILSIVAFIYLFYKKSIKYGVFLSYIATFSLIMLIYGICNDMNIWFLFFQILSGNILFLSVYTLTDYKITPEIIEGEIIYGIILGIISTILRFIIPEFDIIISFILGSIILSPVIDKISYKFKYNKKLYYIALIISLIIIITTIVILSIIF